MSVVNHVSLAVHDLDGSSQFFEQVLAPLGLSLLYRQEGFVAFGTPGCDDFAVHRTTSHSGGAHVAFTAASRGQVDQFWRAALDAGAGPNVAPAIHRQYHDSYYAAFVYDLDGNNIEAVCHDRP